MPGAGRGPGSAFTPLGEDELWRGWILSLARARWRAPDGEAFARDVVHHPGAVAVVPLHDDGSVTLVHQFRPPVGRYVWEVPAGTRDVDGEDPAVTAGRELAEEVGLVADHLRHLVSVWNSPGFTDQRTEIFVATGLRQAAPDRRGVEERFLEVRRWPADAVPSLLRDGPVDETTALGLRLTLERGA